MTLATLKLHKYIPQTSEFDVTVFSVHILSDTF